LGALVGVHHVSLQGVGTSYPNFSHLCEEMFHVGTHAFKSILASLTLSITYRTASAISRVIKLLEHYVGGTMNRLFYVLVLLCSASFVGVGVASADTLQFTLDKGLVPVAVFDLTVNSSNVLTPSASDLNFGFVVQPTNLTVNGAAAPTDFLAFYNATASGGVAIFASAFSMPIYASGPQIYGGDEKAPTLAPGTFSLADGKAATPVIGTYTLTIKDLSNPNVSTPEPSVTILLAIGLLAVGLTVLKFKPNFGVSAS
jgi:hypothetical protein